MQSILKYNRAICRSVKFIEASIAPNFAGSRAHFHLLKRKWAASYPETTGYLLPTLLDLAAQDEEYSRLKVLSKNLANWLVGLQNNDGSYNGGYIGGKQQASVFNTAQILLGLLAADDALGGTQYLSSAEQAARWLMSIQSEDGSWQSHGFKGNHFPSYYTRVAWPMLMAGQRLEMPELKSAGNIALKLINARLNAHDELFPQLGFGFENRVWLHTLAYTIRGLLEAADLLNESAYLLTAKDMIDRLIAGQRSQNPIFGAYDERLIGISTVRCLTGEAQLAICLYRLNSLLNRFHQKETYHCYDELAKQITDELCALQSKKNAWKLEGGLCGSEPFFWGYMALKQPNWATKFFLDALMLTRTYILNEQNSESGSA